MQWIKPGKDFDFMGLRVYFVGFSLLLIAATAVAVFIYPKPRFGTDFVGGTEVEVVLKKAIDIGQLRATVAKVGFHSPEVVGLGGDEDPNRFLIRVKEVSSLSDEQKSQLTDSFCLVPEEGSDAELKAFEGRCPKNLRTEEVKFSQGGEKIAVRYVEGVCGPAQGNVKCAVRADIAKQIQGKVEGIELRAGENNPVAQNPRDNRVEFFLKSKGDQIMDGLRKELGKDVVPDEAERVEWIGPKAGKQLRDAAITSISIAIIFIMIYIAFRFDLRFAPGAIIALIHDVVLAVGAMALGHREITLSTVAALLTIVGYSINDTVVVYDRIRENLGRYRKMTFPKIINRSVTEMLGRTIRTSGLTAVAIIPFLFWGTGVIKDFAFTMLVGVVVGTYSSIYIAAPVTEYIDRKFFGGKVKKKRRVRRRRRRQAGTDSLGATV